MEIKPLKKESRIAADSKSAKKMLKLENLLKELRKKKLPDALVGQINEMIDSFNAMAHTNKSYAKKLEKLQGAILKLIREKLQLVPKNHYRNLWLAIGLSAFGIPIGIVYGLALDNMAFMGIGLPIGMGIGIGIGSMKDKKAMQEGKQIEFENS